MAARDVKVLCATIFVALVGVAYLAYRWKSKRKHNETNRKDKSREEIFEFPSENIKTQKADVRQIAADREKDHVNAIQENNKLCTQEDSTQSQQNADSRIVDRFLRMSVERADCVSSEDAGNLTGIDQEGEETQEEIAIRLVESVISDATEQFVMEQKQRISMASIDSIDGIPYADGLLTPDGATGLYSGVAYAGGYGDNWSTVSTLGSTQSSRKNSLASLNRLVDETDKDSINCEDEEEFYEASHDQVDSNKTPDSVIDTSDSVQTVDSGTSVYEDATTEIHDDFAIPAKNTTDTFSANNSNDLDLDKSSDRPSVKAFKLPLVDRLTQFKPEKVVSFTEGEIKETLEIVSRDPASMKLKHAQVLVHLMTNSVDSELNKVLMVTVNCATFTTNQNLLREAGCLELLAHLLKIHSKEPDMDFNKETLRNITLLANNLSMNALNQNKMEGCLPSLMDIMDNPSTTDSVKLSTLQALTNLSTCTHYRYYTSTIQRFYELIDIGTYSIRLQASKVLVNLSCEPEMILHLLAAKAPQCLLELLLPHEDEEDITLRWVTMLANITRYVQDNHIAPSDLPIQDKAPSPETMYTAIFGLDNPKQMKSKAFVLSKHHNEEIRKNASKLYSFL